MIYATEEGVVGGEQHIIQYTTEEEGERIGEVLGAVEGNEGQVIHYTIEEEEEGGGGGGDSTELMDIQQQQPQEYHHVLDGLNSASQDGLHIGDGGEQFQVVSEEELKLLQESGQYQVIEAVTAAGQQEVVYAVASS